jgi:murein DD-endopeptidase MepM/ murein hydrolase activator NlpD
MFLLRITIITLTCLLSACTTAMIDSFGYGYISQQGRDPHDQGFIVIMPANAPSISQRYKPEESDQMIHHGIDIIGLQTTPIISAADGVVILSHNSIWGNIIVIDHGLSENGMIIRTEYAHLSRRLVEAGEIVKRGQAIGKMGRTLVDLYIFTLVSLSTRWAARRVRTVTSIHIYFGLMVPDV